MALCTAVYVSGGQNYVVANGAIDPSQCTGPVLLSSAEYTDWLAQMVAFGFDQQLFEQAVAAGLLMFVIGLGIGLLISMIRKAKP